MVLSGRVLGFVRWTRTVRMPRPPEPCPGKEMHGTLLWFLLLYRGREAVTTLNNVFELSPGVVDRDWDLEVLISFHGHGGGRCLGVNHNGVYLGAQIVYLRVSCCQFSMRVGKFV